jgi:stage II sporulation SpoAA-like protein
MLELIEGLPGNIVGITVSGRLTRQDCDDVLIPAIAKSLRRHDKIRLYYELKSRFPGAAWDELDLGLEQATRCERCAIVTDIGWVRLTIKALRFLIPGEIRVFATDEADEGRAWITARPGSRADRDISAPDSVRLPLRPQLRRQASTRAISRRAGHFQPTRRPSRASQSIA